VIDRIVAAVLSWLFTKGLELYHSKRSSMESDQAIDAHLKAFKAAYKDAFNGQPVTKEQREKLNQAIADFIRNPHGGGL
jgi:hypothetical protein